MNPPPSARQSMAAHRVETSLVTAIGVFLLVLLPLLNATGAIGSEVFGLVGQFLCYAILAISVDLLWGYSGLLSLGQVLFFALGGYVSGLYLANASGGTGLSFFNFPVTLVLVPLLPGLLAGGIGFLLFRTRMTGVYFALVTQAMALAGWALLPHVPLLGGREGLTNFRTMLGADLRAPSTQRTLFIFTVIVLFAIYAACRWLSGTKFGLVLRALRDGESRVLFSGYASASYKLFAFVLAAVIAGAGGALYVPQAGRITPDELSLEKSLEVVVWVTVGGRGTLVGPILGAVGINLLKFLVLPVCPNLWPALLGGIFTLFLIVLPGGLVSLPSRLAPLRRNTGSKPAPDVPPPIPAAGA